MRPASAAVLFAATLVAAGLAGCGKHKAGGTDLILSPAISYSPANPTAGGTVAITFTIENSSGSNIAFVNVPWTVARDGVPNVFSGVFPQTFTDTPGVGQHVYTIVIDPDHTVTTDDTQADNFQFVPLTVLPAPAG
jgi:hypothetical protein